jgi:hypothetical protein
MDKHIITECYVDTIVIETALSAARGCNHQKGCNNVAKIMQSKLQNKFAIGIIDDDKRKHSYFNEFRQIAASNNAAVRLYRHNEKNHYFIVICPAMEQFIVDSAQQCGVSLTDYNLPAEVKQLADVTKSKESKNNTDLKNLISALKQQNSENICKLVQWIECLNANPRNPSIDAL